MMKFIRKQEKKILAAFGVLLMVSFVATAGYGGRNPLRSQITIGTIGGRPVLAEELQAARQELAAVNQFVAVPRRDPYTGEERKVPLAAVLLGPVEAAAMRDRPETFLLLRREAQAAGLQPNMANADAVITQLGEPTPSEDVASLVRLGVADLFLVRANLERFAANIKISQPEIDQTLAKTRQSVALEVVDFASTRFETGASKPTTQAVAAQFEKYSDVVPGSPTSENPFGFGYRLPVRAGLQYLTISHEAVAKAAASTKTDYDWDVQANQYYLLHPEDFQTSAADAAKANSPTSRPAIASGPTTRPFAEVKADVLETIRRPMVDKLTLDVQSRLLAGLQNTWTASKSPGATQAGKNSATYGSYRFLRELAESVKTESGVDVPVTDRSSPPLSEIDLAALPGIGRSSTGTQPFAQYVISLANMPASQQQQPSAPLNDASTGDLYLFRLTKVAPAEKATDLPMTSGRVSDDLQGEAAFERARTAAEKLLADARGGPLGAAATKAGQPLLTPKPFTLGSDSTGIQGVPMTSSAQARALSQIGALVGEYDPAHDAHPVGIIPLPADGRVLAIRLLGIHADIGTDLAYLSRLATADQLRSALEQSIRPNWFKYENVAARIDFKPASGADRS